MISGAGANAAPVMNPRNESDWDLRSKPYTVLKIYGDATT